MYNLFEPILRHLIILILGALLIYLGCVLIRFKNSAFELFIKIFHGYFNSTIPPKIQSILKFVILVFLPGYLIVYGLYFVVFDAIDIFTAKIFFRKLLFDENENQILQLAFAILLISNFIYLFFKQSKIKKSIDSTVIQKFLIQDSNFAMQIFNAYFITSLLAFLLGISILIYFLEIIFNA